MKEITIDNYENTNLYSSSMSVVVSMPPSFVVQVITNQEGKIVETHIM